MLKDAVDPADLDRLTLLMYRPPRKRPPAPESS